MPPLKAFHASDVVDNLMSNKCRARLIGADIAIQGMSIDSRAVEKGCLFVCKGVSFKPQFLSMALASGASAYMCEKSAEEALARVAPDAPHIVVEDIRRAMALAAAFMYDHPDRALNVIGITGTKGKSTTAYMLRSILDAADMPSSILGSIETDDGLVRHESHNTTPEAPDLWRHLHNTEQSGRKVMVMEVSSHGLKYERVLGLHFETACFLNIGRDHISPVEHSDFEDYFSSKLKIFDQCSTAVVNIDSDHKDRILDAARKAQRIVTFSAEQSDADYTARNISLSARGTSFDLIAEGEARRIDLGIAGRFNVSNALAAIVMARLSGINFDSIEKGLSSVRVPGRMEIVASSDEESLAIVDYAHNELSFKTLFESVKNDYPGRKIIAVFGAPGGKAEERRECLPRVAAQYADFVIYTEEDPAHERVEDICAELAANTPSNLSYEVIVDREQAIEQAFRIAEGHPSVVLLLAKGDETSQHRGDRYVEVESDLSIAKRILMSCH